MFLTTIEFFSRLLHLHTLMFLWETIYMCDFGDSLAAESMLNGHQGLPNSFPLNKQKKQTCKNYDSNLRVQFENRHWYCQEVTGSHSNLQFLPKYLFLEGIKNDVHVVIGSLTLSLRQFCLIRLVLEQVSPYPTVASYCFDHFSYYFWTP